MTDKEIRDWIRERAPEILQNMYDWSNCSHEKTAATSLKACVDLLSFAYKKSPKEDDDSGATSREEIAQEINSVLLEILGTEQGEEDT
jgi:hypothetical protein